MKLRTCLALGIMLLTQTIAYGNNISITKVRLTDTNTVAKTVVVKFNLSWENSWRDAVNWDAAWVFIKYKSKKGKWKHLTMSLTGNAIGGSNIPVKINVPQDKKGAFVYRQGAGNGTTQITDLTFSWNYGTDGLADLDSLETRVFATEMVYVPEGSFVVGDGVSAGRLRNRDIETDYVIISDTASVPIIRRINENSGGGISGTPTFTIWVDGKKGIDLAGNGVYAKPDFPTGYNAFYCMKYEVTQGQYADLLNTLSWDPALVNPEGINNVTNDYTTFFPKPAMIGQRFTITLKDSVYVAARPDRGCNMMTGFGLTFADWSGLRPMSEFEFEKACRGPLAPVPNETAAGVSYIANMPDARSILSGEENGTEKVSTNASYIPYIYSTNIGGDGGTGPLRAGIWATDSSTRIRSGATYYGIMDMTNNLLEYIVYYDLDQNFNGGHGDGYVPGYQFVKYHNATGFWPILNDADNLGFRSKLTTVSGCSDGGLNTYMGFHGVRTAPAEN